MSTDWMSKMLAADPDIGNLYLNQIVIPGSHDSGTADCKGFLLPSIPEVLHGIVKKIPATTSILERENIAYVSDLIRNDSRYIRLLNYAYELAKGISQAQSLSIEEQLQAGVRYFDFRIHIEANRLIIVHGVVSTKLGLDEALTAIRKFMSIHDEIVLIDTKVETEDESVRTRVVSAIEHNLYVVDPLHPDTQLMSEKRELVHAGQRKLKDHLQSGRVIVGWPHDTPPGIDNKHYFWPRIMDSYSTWANSDNVDYLQDFFFQKAFTAPGHCWVAQGQLTGPSPGGNPLGLAELIFKSALYHLSKEEEVTLIPSSWRYGGKSLSELAEISNPKLKDWVECLAHRLNIVMADFCQTDEFIKAAIEVNKDFFKPRVVEEIKVANVTTDLEGNAKIGFNRALDKAHDGCGYIEINSPASAALAKTAIDAMVHQHEVKCFGQLCRKTARFLISEIAVRN